MSTGNNKFIKDFIMVTFSNGIVLMSSILTGLVVPKLLGVTNYGYYKIFTLYLGYTALLHFGFVDGVLLKHGGEDYDSLNIYKFRCSTQFFIAFQAFISILIALVALICFKGIYKFIFVVIGINTIVNNLMSYYQYVSQATMKFKELSICKIFQAILKIIATVAFFVLHVQGIIGTLSCYIYITTLVLIDSLLLFWYVYTYRNITFGKSQKWKDNKGDFIFYFKSGIALTVAFQVANLVFNLDRQFVSVLYDTNTYAVYSFAYSLISMATTIIGAVSLVLFPNLKRKSEDKIIKEFPTSMSLITILAFAVHIGYYPLCIFIKWFLPEYAASLDYFRIIFPGLAVSCCITTIIFTYYKVLNKNFLYFIICCVILVVSALLNAVAYMIFHSPAAISAVSIVVMIIWYLLGEMYFIKIYHIKWIKNFVYIIIMGALFYLITSITNNAVTGCIAYTVVFVVVTYFFYNDLVRSNAGRLLNK